MKFAGELCSRQTDSKERLFRGQMTSLGALMPLLQLHLLMAQNFTNSANKYQFLDLVFPMVERLTAIAQLFQPLR